MRKQHIYHEMKNEWMNDAEDAEDDDFNNTCDDDDDVSEYVVFDLCIRKRLRGA